MPLRLATLLTVVLLAILSWGGETKVAPKQRAKESRAEEQARAAQRVYEESLRRQCLAAGDTPDCSEHRREQERRLLDRYRDLFPNTILPIPAEHLPRPTLKKI